MARQNINIGTSANDTTGDSIRVALDKSNDNFIDLYAAKAALAAATFTGLVSTPASAASSAGFRLVAGVAPTSPVNGDMWQDGTNLKIRIGGVTRTITIT